MSKAAETWGWERLVAAEDWDAVENWWRSWFCDHGGASMSLDQREPLHAVLAALREVVPLIWVGNGMERTERHIKPTDSADDWRDRERLKGAAKILFLGELQAAAEGDPPQASEIWAGHRRVIEDHLQQFGNQPEATEGAKELSRVAHAEAALDLLSSIDVAKAMLSGELTDEADRTWLGEVIAEIAFLAFEAGRNTQAAWGKEFESFAVTRQRQIESLRFNNEGRSEINRQRTRLGKKRREHARLVENTFPTKTSRKSERAAHIWKHWNKVGAEELRPDRPEQKTIQNWLSSGK